MEGVNVSIHIATDEVEVEEEVEEEDVKMSDLEIDVTIPYIALNIIVFITTTCISSPPGIYTPTEMST